MSWKDDAPKGVKKVIRSETELALAAYRTQLFNPADLDNVKKVQAGYKAQTLSAFLGQPASPAVPAIDFIKPLTPAEEKTSPQFFEHPELPAAILPDGSVRKATHGLLRQDPRWRREDDRCCHALARN